MHAFDRWTDVDSKVQSNEVRCAQKGKGTVNGKVVRHSLAYLTVHKWFVGDIPLNIHFVSSTVVAAANATADATGQSVLPVYLYKSSKKTQKNTDKETTYHFGQN